MGRGATGDRRGEDLAVEVVEVFAQGVALRVEGLRHDDARTAVEEVADEEFEELIVVAHGHVVLALGLAVGVVGEVLHFLERPEEGFALTGFGQHLVGRNAGVGLGGVANDTGLRG